MTIREKFIKDITSKSIVPLIIGTIAFFTTAKFPAWALISVFGIYCGYNLGGKYIATK